MNLPENVTNDTITPKWLNANLGITTIRSIRMQRIGEDAGHTAVIYRIHLSHKNENNGQSAWGKLDTIVMKVMDASTSYRRAFELLNIREVLFYSKIAPLLNLDSIPICYYAYYDQQTRKGRILMEDAGRAIHKGEVQTATVAQAKKAMAELGKLHGTSFTKMSEIPTDLSRPFEPDSEEMCRAFPAFAKTWGPYLGEEGLRLYERAVDAYEKKWLVQKNSFVQGLVHGDYRIGNVIFGCESGEHTTQAESMHDNDARELTESIKMSIAQRHLTGQGVDATQARLETTSNKRVEKGEGGKLDNSNGVKAIERGPQPERASRSNVKDPTKTEDTANDYINELKFKQVDWQTVSRGPIFFDVAYFLSISLDSTTRQSCEVDLIYAWYTACREAAGEFFPTSLNVSRCVHEISIACIKAVLISVTTLNNVQAPEMAMRMLGDKLNMVSQTLVDWRSLE